MLNLNYNLNDIIMKNWQKAIIKSNVTLEDVIKNLSENSFRISLVVDSEGTLLGTIADGDIRRAFLRGSNLNSSIKNIINKNPIVASSELSHSEILNLMIKNKVLQIPIVDHNNQITDLSLWDELKSPIKLNNKMIIMAGGKGTRLQPHTANCPKPMVKVLNKPILEHIIERAKNNGFSNFILAINHLGFLIEEYFNDGKKFNVNINYIKEESFLGTAGAISLLNPKPKEPIVVTNGDVLTDIDYSKILDFHNKNKAKATIAVRMHEFQHPFGVIETDGMEMISVKEKPIIANYINAGIYVLSPESIEKLQKNKHCDMTTLIQNLKSDGDSVIVYPMHEPWLDIGRSKDLSKANKK